MNFLQFKFESKIIHLEIFTFVEASTLVEI